MPKMNFGIADAADIEAADGYPVYKGELPPNGAYEAVLKVCKVGKIANGADKGKNRLMLVAILDDPDNPEYDGCPAFDNKNLTDQGVPYVNQFLESLTDGTDKAKTAVKRAFWKTGPIVDDAKEHILKIGTIKVDSPKGGIRVLIGTKQNTYQGNTTLRIQQWMMVGEGGSSSGPDSDEVVEPDEVEVDEVDDVDEDDDDVDDEDPYEDDDTEE